MKRNFLAMAAGLAMCVGLVACDNQKRLDDQIMLGLGEGLGNSSTPVGEPTLEMPTLRSLGVWWAVKGDANKNARIAFEYRKAGTEVWQRAPDLWRVDKGKYLAGKKKLTSAVVPEGAWLFAGSALMLEPATAYELKLTLTDPDGGSPSGSVRSSDGPPLARRERLSERC